MPKQHLDRIAWRILDRLQRDARIPNADLAREVGLSPSPCLRRVRELEQSGVIKGILYRKLSTLRDPDRLSSWLISTAHRECYRVGRQSGRHAGLDRELADLERPSEERVEAWERQQLVRQALRQLGGRCEELLLALFANSDPPRYEEIAEKLGMKVGSIGPTRVRCFKKLEKILAELGLEKEVRRDTTSRELPQPMVA